MVRCIPRRFRAEQRRAAAAAAAAAATTTTTTPKFPNKASEKECTCREEEEKNTHFLYTYIRSRTFMDSTPTGFAKSCASCYITGTSLWAIPWITSRAKLYAVISYYKPHNFEKNPKYDENITNYTLDDHLLFATQTSARCKTIYSVDFQFGSRLYREREHWQPYRVERA